MASSYNVVLVGSSATVILASSNERKGALVANNGSSTVYIGMNSSVTTANGFPLLAGAVFNNSGQNAVWKGAIYGIVSTGSCDVRYWEWTQ